MTKSDDEKRVLGFIGGSGLYAIDGLQNAEELTFAAPWGTPSGPVIAGDVNGVAVRFLSRHGPGHALPPGAINYRANIDALKRAGATDLISISACGSFREELAPGTFVVIDQFMDRTTGRNSSFFGEGCVAHVSMAHPVCPTLADAAAAACADLDIPVRQRGTYVCIDGPQFSSLAESKLYQSWGCDVIGMTNMPEAKLAREAELPYATIAMVTDYDCWHEEAGPVDVASVLAVMEQNTLRAKALIPALVDRLGAKRAPSPLGVESCLDFAIITPPEHRSAERLAKLDAVAGRALRLADPSKS